MMQMVDDAAGPEAPTEAPEATPIPYADPSIPHPVPSLSSGVTRGDVAALTVRIVGVYVFLQGLPFTAYAFQYPFFSRYSAPFLITVVVFVGLGTLLITQAGWIARWLLPKQVGDGVSPREGSPDLLQAVAFSVIGVLLGAGGCRDIAYLIWRYTFESIRSIPHESFGLTWFKPTVELAMGIWLFFGSKRLSRYWRRSQDSAAEADESGPL
jgi:hypothetical protein